jgi:hypothetical protein
LGVSRAVRRRLAPVVTACFVAAAACSRGGDRAERERPLPDTLPVRRFEALDSALAVDGITVEYHWEAPDTAPPGLAVSRYASPVPQAEIALLDSVAFDLTGAVEAVVSPAGPGAFVALRTSTAGGERLLHTTTWHEGERIGVVVNGHLMTVATVRNPLTNMLPVTDIVPTDQARALAERVNHRLRSGS